MGDSTSGAAVPSSPPITASPDALARLTSALAAFEQAKPKDRLAAHLAVGEAILAAFYDGRLEVWNRPHLKDGRSPDAVVQCLKQLGYSTWTTHRVRRSVKLHEQDVFHGGLERRWPYLSLYHFVAVTAAPLDQQRQFLEEANEKVLPVGAITDAVRRWRGQRPTPHASPDAIFHWVEQLRRALRQREHNVSELRRAWMSEEDLIRFGRSFEHFAGELDELVLKLADLGADVPVPEMKALLARKRK